MRRLIIHLIFIAGMIFTCALSCSKGGSRNADGLSITGISIDSGPYNTSVVITGTGFSTNTSFDNVTFNGTPASVLVAKINQLTVKVPKGASTGKIAVSVANTTVLGPLFTYVYTLTVSTLAGNDQAISKDGIGSNASFHDMWGIAADSKGNIYAPDPTDNIIRKITSAGIVTTIAGSGTAGYADGIGLAASFHTPQNVAVDSVDNVYVTDTFNRMIRKIAPDGTVTTLAEGLINLQALTIGGDNNLYVYDSQGIQKITTAGVVTTAIGVSGSLDITGMARNKNGVFFTTDAAYIFSITSPVIGFVEYAGNGNLGYADGHAFEASFDYVGDVIFDNQGNLIVADTDNGLIREITPNVDVSTLLGKLHSGYPPIDGPASVATFTFPFSIAFDPSGNLYVQDETHRIRKVVFE